MKTTTMRYLIAALFSVLLLAGLPSQGLAQQQTVAGERPVPFMFGLFNAQRPQPVPLTPEQMEHEQKWAAVSTAKKFQIKDEMAPRKVRFSGYRPGTIVVDTANKVLYFVESPLHAIRYPIAVGQIGLQAKGTFDVGEKKAWPSWRPTNSMIERKPGQYARYADGVDGGLNNPLGARAIYLHLDRQDTMLRIHGTNAPHTIGTASSNGCYRMYNQHVIDLFNRVKVGAEVVVI